LSTEIKDPYEQTKDELALSIAEEQRKLNAEPPAEEKPVEKTRIEYKATDGTIYEAETQEELFKKVTAALENTKAAVKDRERQVHELKQPKTVVEESKEPKTFDRDHYFTLMESDPVKAAKYMDKHRFGVDNPEELFQSMTVEQKKQQLVDETARFYNTPAGKAFAKVETPELGQLLVSHVREQDLPITANNLRAAYYELWESEKIPAPVDTTVSEKKRVMPPTVHGTRNDNTEDAPDFSRMSRTELAAYLRKQGLDVHVQ
jgi:hypothetical protein